MSKRKIKKYLVRGRIRADIEYKLIVEAKTSTTACKIAEEMIYDRCGITFFDVLDDEQYCELI